MAKAGKIKVKLTASQCAASAHWLRNNYKSPSTTLMGDAADKGRSLSYAKQLEKQFRRAGHRKTREKATRLFDRGAAAWFGDFGDIAALRIIPLPAPDVLSTMLACRKAAQLGKVGRRRISRSEDEVRRLSLGNRYGEDGRRYRQRLTARARKERLLSQWFERMHSAGGTLLTYSEPPLQN